MARFMARNSKWPENIFYGQRGANMARFEKSGHQMANLAALRAKMDERTSVHSFGDCVRASPIELFNEDVLPGNRMASSLQVNNRGRVWVALCRWMKAADFEMD